MRPSQVAIIAVALVGLTLSLCRVGETAGKLFGIDNFYAKAIELALTPALTPREAGITIAPYYPTRNPEAITPH